MKLRNKPTYIRVSKEEIRTGKVNISKIIYFLILALLISSILLYILSRTYYIQANGQVIFDVTYIQPDREIRINKFFIREGDNVKKGDPLLEYQVTSYLYDINTSGDESTLRYNLDIFRLRRDKEEKDIQKKAVQEEIELLQGDLERMLKLKSLEAYVRKETFPLEKRIDELRVKKRLLEQEAELLSNMAKQLPKGTHRLPGVQSFDYKSNAIMYAPADGQATKIYKETYEIVPKGENIIALHQVNNPRIKAYFEQDAIKFISSGLKVDIEFPDGTQSCGIIEKFYPNTTLPLPEEFQKRSEPVHRALIVDIQPCQGYLDKWKYFYKMNVKVKVKRWKI